MLYCIIRLIVFQGYISSIVTLNYLIINLLIFNNINNINITTLFIEKKFPKNKK